MVLFFPEFLRTYRGPFRNTDVLPTAQNPEIQCPTVSRPSTHVSSICNWRPASWWGNDHSSPNLQPACVVQFWNTGGGHQESHDGVVSVPLRLSLRGFWRFLPHGLFPLGDLPFEEVLSIVRQRLWNGRRGGNCKHLLWYTCSLLSSESKITASFQR